MDRLALMRRERESLEFTSKLFDSLNVGICVATYPSGVIERANALFFKLIGSRDGHDALAPEIRSLFKRDADLDRFLECQCRYGRPEGA